MGHKTIRQYGLWDSPITPASLAGDLRLNDVQWDPAAGALLWTEGRSGAGALVAVESLEQAPRDLTRDFSVRAEVGYGGGDFTVHGGVAYFLVHKTGRLFRQVIGGGRARPITPGFGRAASPCISPDGRWAAYVHHDTERVDRLAIVDTEGRHWPRILVEGNDFYMQPRFSPDGRYLAWIAWDHPCMPWDGSVLCLAEVKEPDAGGLPSLGPARTIAGGEDVAVFQPEFSSDGSTLVFVSDASGWSHIWAVAIDGAEPGEPRQVSDGEAEYGVPAWGQGMRTYALVPGTHRAVCARSEQGFVSLESLDLDSGERQAVAGISRYSDAGQLTVSSDGKRVAFLGAAPRVPGRVLVHDLDRDATRVVARASGESVPEAALSQPEAVSWATTGGETAHGLFFPPASLTFDGVGSPPLLVLVHGGPTGQVRAGWNAQAQYFATRGFGVLSVNYRGSTGYGRDYMTRLRGHWGIYDVDDCVTGMRALADQGRIDPSRSAIMGGSAGGFTVLQTMVTEPEAFSAGVCLFGVSNQFHLAAETHKFEERYLDSLLGPLPEAAAVYRERSPVFHADAIRRPLAVFQGEIDQVVPRNQSDVIVEALERRGTPHIYHVYPDEGHGWRKKETIEHFYKTVDEFLRQHLVFS